MRILRTEFDAIQVIELMVWRDARGFFMETWRHSRYGNAGIAGRFVQDNVSRSSHGVVRGLHFQKSPPNEKLVSVLDGEIFDVVVDLRRKSPTFAKWCGIVLSSCNAMQIYIPAGFAHGFCVLSESAIVAYKCTAEYDPDRETSVAWNDPRLAIGWPARSPILSGKDATAPFLDQIPMDRLPDMDGA